MVIDIKPGRYTAQLRLESVSWWTTRFTELTHHLVVTHDGEILETHYDCDLGYGVSEHRFEMPRSWHPSFLDSYELKADMSDAC